MTRLFRLALLALLMPLGAAAEPLTVFAAASLKGPLDTVAAEVEAEGGGPVRLSYGGSGLLARQVAQGAPADVVLLANADWMETLEAEGLVADPVVLFSNSLVLVAPLESTAAPRLEAESLIETLDGGRLVIGLTTSVPAGIYGKAALEALNLWEPLAPHVAETDNVRAALALVARGEAPLGLVYATDARAEPGVRVVAELPDDSHPPIRYTGAVTRDSAAPGAAAAFLDRVAGHPAFVEAGFLPPADG